jgi:hypothetical protein
MPCLLIFPLFGDQNIEALVVGWRIRTATLPYGAISAPELRQQNYQERDCDTIAIEEPLLPVF